MKLNCFFSLPFLTYSWWTSVRHCALQSLQWRHNQRGGVSNHWCVECLLNRLLRRWSNKTSKLRVTCLCEGNPPVTSAFPSQRARNAENVSIWWCRHENFTEQGKWTNIGCPSQTHLNFKSRDISVPKTYCSVVELFWNFAQSTVVLRRTLCKFATVPRFLSNYNDAIMKAMTSQIINLTIVYSVVYSDAHQRKHPSSASLTFVRGIHRWPVNSPYKGPVTRKMFPFDDVIMIWLIAIGGISPISSWM